MSQTSPRSTGAFIDDEDRRFYLAAMFDAARAGGVAVHACALAHRQVQLLATPETADALGRFMQRLGRRYVHAFNRRHGSVGPLWSSRYGATALLTERFLLDALRTVDQLPVREGVCTVAREWCWSSASHHVGVKSDFRLVDPSAYWSLGNTPFERQTRYAELLALMMPTETVNLIEKAARSGWPLATEAESVALEDTEAGLIFRPRPRGRPRRTL